MELLSSCLNTHTKKMFYQTTPDLATGCKISVLKSGSQYWTSFNFFGTDDIGFKSDQNKQSSIRWRHGQKDISHKTNEMYLVISLSRKRCPSTLIGLNLGESTESNIHHIMLFDTDFWASCFKWMRSLSWCEKAKYPPPIWNKTTELHIISTCSSTAS